MSVIAMVSEDGKFAVSLKFRERTGSSAIYDPEPMVGVDYTYHVAASAREQHSNETRQEHCVFLGEPCYCDGGFRGAYPERELGALLREEFASSKRYNL